MLENLMRINTNSHSTIRKREQQNNPAVKKYVPSPPHVPPSSFSASSPFCLSVSVSVRLSVCLSQHGSATSLEKKRTCPLFPSCKRWRREESWGRAAEQRLPNEKTYGNPKMPFLGQVEICSSRKAAKVNYLVKLLKFLELQSSVERKHARGGECK